MSAPTPRIGVRTFFILSRDSDSTPGQEKATKVPKSLLAEECKESILEWEIMGTSQPQSQPRNELLTDQEHRVLCMACRGMSYREIAEHVYLAESTVKKIMHRCVRKLGVSSMRKAVFVCLREGIVNIEDLCSIEELISCYVQEVPERMILTPRERELLALAGRGLTNLEIADTAGISVSGVKNCLSSALGKLGAHTRQKAIWLAMWRGCLNNLEIVTPEEVAEIVSASGLQAAEAWFAVLEEKLDAIDPMELQYEPYVSNIGKLNRLRELMRERLAHPSEAEHNGSLPHSKAGLSPSRN